MTTGPLAIASLNVKVSFSSVFRVKSGAISPVLGVRLGNSSNIPPELRGLLCCCWASEVTDSDMTRMSTSDMSLALFTSEPFTASLRIGVNFHGNHTTGWG